MSFFARQTCRQLLIGKESVFVIAAYAVGGSFVSLSLSVALAVCVYVCMCCVCVCV